MDSSSPQALEEDSRGAVVKLGGSIEGVEGAGVDLDAVLDPPS